VQLVPGKGYHFPDGGAFVEYDGTLPASLPLPTGAPPRSGSGSGGGAAVPFEWFSSRVARAVAALVAADAPTTVRTAASDDAAALAAAGLVPGDVAHLPAGATVRIVSVGGACNTCPCGGTHVRSAGEIGRLVLTRVTSKKGKTKLSYELLGDAV